MPDKLPEIPPKPIKIDFGISKYADILIKFIQTTGII